MFVQVVTITTDDWDKPQIGVHANYRSAFEEVVEHARTYWYDELGPIPEVDDEAPDYSRSPWPGELGEISDVDDEIVNTFFGTSSDEYDIDEYEVKGF